VTDYLQQFGSSRWYKRYKLSDHKTFDTMFFREKASFLQLLANFENKTGEYTFHIYTMYIEQHITST
jgi:hypothetical protein